MQQISSSLPLFIGSFKSSKNLEELRHHQITHILIVKDEKESYIKAVFPPEFVYEQVFLQNSPFENLTRVIQPTGRWISNVIHGGRVRPDQENRVLVHCVGGISRAPAILIGYLMEFEGFSYDDAFILIQQKRLCINLIDTFTTQLRGYEHILDAQRQSTILNQDLSSHSNRSTSKRVMEEMDELEMQKSSRHVDMNNTRLPILEAHSRKRVD